MLYTNRESQQEGAHMVTGRYPVSSYQQLINYIDDVIYENGKVNDDGFYILNFNQLDEIIQGKLVKLSIEYDGLDTYDCFHENKKAEEDSITRCLLKALKDNDPNSWKDLAFSIRNNSINRYRNFLQDLIDDRCDFIYQHEGAYEE